MKNTENNNKNNNNKNYDNDKNKIPSLSNLP